MTMTDQTKSTKTQRTVIYAMMVSLDGYMEGPDGDIDWSFPDEELHKHFNEQESEIDINLYGRGLYENMSNYWPTADLNPSAPQVEIDFARIWKSKSKVVFSKTLEQVEWNSRLVRENIAEEIVKLKEQPGKNLSVGGSGIASTFMKLGLIDEFRLYIHPVVVGGGKPMFHALDYKINLRLVETKVFSSGVVLLRYQRADGGQ
ncbi:MAG: bifunctional deaminase-reductase domain protein [Bacilli bacterium]|nr:bifunctional deaminase-reductase domain protein [Bacilli bacterium]